MSIVSFLLTVILTVITIGIMGAGFVKSAISSKHCYISENGDFYYDIEDDLKPYNNSEKQDYTEYFTDWETIYYSMADIVFWDKDGAIRQKSARLDIKLFDFSSSHQK